MNAERNRPARRMEALTTPPALRWDLCLIAVLALVGVLAPPLPRG